MSKKTEMREFFHNKKMSYKAGGTFTKVGTYDIAAPLPKVKE